MAPENLGSNDKPRRARGPGGALPVPTHSSGWKEGDDRHDGCLPSDELGSVRLRGKSRRRHGQAHRPIGMNPRRLPAEQPVG